MAPKRVAAGRKLEGAQAVVKIEEIKRDHEIQKDVVKVEKGDTGAEYKKNEDREIDDLLDYVEVKLEDLELEGKKMEVLAAAPKTEEEEKRKGDGVPKAAKAKNNSEAAKMKPEATAPETETIIVPKPKGSAAAPTAAAATPKAKEGKRAKAEEDFYSKWDEYFGKRELADWQRLCRDLGLPGDLPSKTQCRKALETVNVNIKQFLDAMNEGGEVKFFENVRKLARFTRKKGLWMPKRELPKGDPLRKLLREVNKYL